ncbi:MAG: hypothetical protein PHR06_02865 [Candidatus Cloacimonetes bacterium]|nr:hypothetical protein [Candidatus Cloacimonadota bacterium]
MNKYEFHTRVSSDGTILLPENCQIKNHKVRIILFDEEIETKVSSRKLFGILGDYADESLLTKEKNAVQYALRKKHEID